MLARSRVWVVFLFCLNCLALRADEASLTEGVYAEINTPRGAILAKLFYDRALLTTANFVGLAEGTLGPKKGTPFFDGLTFHRVVPNFVVQGGDPQGNGEGGPGYLFSDEFRPGLRHNSVGMLSMANDGPDTNGSQFFITLRDVNRLNYLHSVFGRVVRGLETLPLIKQGDTMTVKILRVGPAAEAFKVDQSLFDKLAAQVKKYTAEKEPGPTAHFNDPDQLLPTDVPRARNFNFKLANYERTTGLKICTRLYAKFAPEKPEQKTAEFTRELAEKLGVQNSGALIVYFEDLKEWRLWIGHDQLPAFNPEHKTLADRKHEVLVASQVEAERVIVSAPTPPGPAQRLKIQTDTLIDAILLQLEPKS